MPPENQLDRLHDWARALRRCADDLRELADRRGEAWEHYAISFESAQAHEAKAAELELEAAQLER